MWKRALSITEEDRSKLHPALLYSVTSIPTSAPSLPKFQKQKTDTERTRNKAGDSSSTLLLETTRARSNALYRRECTLPKKECGR